MSRIDPQVRIPIGVVIERRRAKSPWVDFIWRPVAVLPGVPDAAPWTPLDGDADRMNFYAGAAALELHRSDTAAYRDNLETGTALLWVVLRPMSDPEDSTENFVQRWSRRKRATETPADEPARREPRDADSRPSAPPENAVPASDITALPPIESMTATSDVRAFLAPGVPEELTRAALRRAWVIDPTIRDFVGLAENQWDFTKPDGIPGFGSLELTSELRHIVAGVFGNALGQSPPAYTKTEPVEQLTEALPELPSATPAQSPEDAEVMRSDAPGNVAISAVNPQDSLPVVPLDDKKAAPRQSPREGIESDDR